VSKLAGLVRAANTPPEVVATIQREVAKVLSSKAVRERLEATGNEVVGSTPGGFDAKFKADLAKIC